jgi:hypothetical protein
LSAADKATDSCGGIAPVDVRDARVVLLDVVSRVDWEVLLFRGGGT